MRNRILTMVLLALGCGVAGGCSSLEVKPWVSPYERNNLADPIMSFQRAPISAGYITHVYQVREGASGAEGSTGGGCGCN
ncbi:MAG: hypothetical protein CMQ43_03960 [Gammaproteobacteria bacterium]|nr:hypothetical protein [Gammaproteobacteria bacterium]MBK80053.1 hypothetical protein [Gammaproteobacteria bacterium]|tara:strand:+ start:3499 stop:3738 length:240 start_codon:yes stop_codon:yes gene_type:complete